MKTARARSAASARNVGRCVAILPGSAAGRQGESGPEALRSSVEYRCAHAGGPACSSGEAPVIGVERRGRVVRDWFVRSTGGFSGRSGMGELKASVKRCDISKREVWDAWVKVRGNKGASGVDGVSIEAFEADLRNNLYKVWNR